MSDQNKKNEKTAKTLKLLSQLNITTEDVGCSSTSSKHTTTSNAQSSQHNINLNNNEK
jgi:hypothetical protein